jgi:hypothetical protein
MKYDRVVVLAESMNEGPEKGDWILEWGDVSATYKNGRHPVTIKFHEVHRVKDGKIELASAFYNVADIMTQQGFKFVPPGEPKKAVATAKQTKKAAAKKKGRAKK